MSVQNHVSGKNRDSRCSGISHSWCFDISHYFLPLYNFMIYTKATIRIIIHSSQTALHTSYPAQCLMLASENSKGCHWSESLPTCCPHLDDECLPPTPTLKLRPSATFVTRSLGHTTDSLCVCWISSWVFSVKVKIWSPFPFMWALEMMLQNKWVVLSRLGNLAALGLGVRLISSSPRNCSQGAFEPWQEQRWQEEGQDYSRLVANDEKGLCYLSLISGFALAALQGWLLQEIWIRAHPPRQINGMCLQSSLKHFSVALSIHVPTRVQLHGAALSSRHPLCPLHTWALEQQVTSWRFMVCLYCPFRPPAMGPVPGLSPPLAVCLETSFEKQPRGVGGTFFSASVLIQNAPFYTKGGNADSLYEENYR